MQMKNWAYKTSFLFVPSCTPHMNSIRNSSRIQTVIICLLFAILLIAANTVIMHTVYAQDDGLPLEIQAAMIMGSAKQNTVAEKWDDAARDFEKLMNLGVELPDESYFHYGKVLFKAGKYDKSLVNLKKYLGLTDKEGEFYKDAIGYVVEAKDKKVEHAERTRNDILQRLNTFLDQVKNDAILSTEQTPTSTINGQFDQYWNDYIMWKTKEYDNLGSYINKTLEPLKAILAEENFEECNRILDSAIIDYLNKIESLKKHSKQKEFELYLEPTVEAILIWLPKALSGQKVEGKSSSKDRRTEESRWIENTEPMQYEITNSSIKGMKLQIKIKKTQDFSLSVSHYVPGVFISKWDLCHDYKEQKFWDLTYLIDLAKLSYCSTKELAVNKYKLNLVTTAKDIHYYEKSWSIINGVYDKKKYKGKVESNPTLQEERDSLLLYFNKKLIGDVFSILTKYAQTMAEQ